MTKCRACKGLIGLSSPVYKLSRGFLQEGFLVEDSSIVVHVDCYNSTRDLAEQLELDIKNN